MKLNELGLSAKRVIDTDTDIQYLRLFLPEAGGAIWYKPTENGFDLVSDLVADELDAAFKEVRNVTQN